MQFAAVSQVYRSSGSSAKNIDWQPVVELEPRTRHCGLDTGQSELVKQPTRSPEEVPDGAQVAVQSPSPASTVDRMQQLGIGENCAPQKSR